MKRKIFSSCLFIIIFSVPYLLTAQTVQDSTRNGAVKVYLDCLTCDMNYTREQIPYVNYVRDVKEAEVFILVTYQPTGSKGMEYTYFFNGAYKFAGLNDTLVYSSGPDETTSVVREKRTNMLKLGLMRYVARTPLADEISIKHSAKLEKEEVKDNWNYWVFELQTSPRYNGEETYKRLMMSNSINISRVTPGMKLEIDLSQSYNRQKYIFDGGLTTTYIRTEKEMQGLYVKSLNNHWSAGLKTDVLAATNPNYDLNVQLMPAIEYDLYPYSEATHRQLRINYAIGGQFCNYIDSTIYNKVRETLYKQELNIAYQVQEKWGSINLSLSGSNYFHDWSKNKLELNSIVRLRIIKGLSLSVNGGVGYINDQLNLRKGNLTEAERLLRLKEQATSFSVNAGFSVTYTFGSIYNNVVNPRFGNGMGMGNMMMGGFDR